jgi:hypothetical protein
MSFHLRSEGTGSVKMSFSVADCLLFKLIWFSRLPY